MRDKKSKETRAILCSIGTRREDASPELLYALKTLAPVFASALVDDEPILSDLAPREVELLKWIRDGKTVWEASRIMAISESTVKFHLKNTYRKLGVSSKPQAVAVGIRKGLIA